MYILYYIIFFKIHQMVKCQKSQLTPFFLSPPSVSSPREAMRDGRVKKGDLLACCGFGAGLTWGGAVPWCRGGADGGDAV